MKWQMCLFHRLEMSGERSDAEILEGTKVLSVLEDVEVREVEANESHR